MEWAGEALLNDADGYYGGNHNFYIYDQGAKGFVFLPNDTDSTFDWLVLNDKTPYNDHPIYWWEGRAPPRPHRRPVWLAVMNDPASRAQYVDAIATSSGSWDVAQMQGWIDSWSQQIADDVAADPARLGDAGAASRSAVAAARDVVAKRRAVPAELRRLRAATARATTRTATACAGATTAATTTRPVHPGARRDLRQRHRRRLQRRRRRRLRRTLATGKTTPTFGWRAR